jgi:hypothetical protein
MRRSAQLENSIDDLGPPLSQEGEQHGGARLFKDIAACPFRAFARHRLGAKALEDSSLGPSYLERGTTVHKVLQLLWTELESHARLVSMDERELRDLIARKVKMSLAASHGPGRMLEQQRLERLLFKWLQLEASRQPFFVSAQEEERVAAIGGLSVRVRVDRRDQLPDGRAILLDYKTGEVKSTAWDTDRPDEPQLPLYCISAAAPTAGAVIAQIRSRELGFRGLTDGISLPAMKTMKIDPPLPFHAQIDGWKRSLERLAFEYRSGHAKVNPKKDACEHCGLWALCRIRESADDRR